MKNSPLINLYFNGQYQTIKMPQTYQELLLEASQKTKTNFEDMKNYSFKCKPYDDEEYIIKEENFGFFLSSKPKIITMFIPNKNNEQEPKRKVPKNSVIEKILEDIKIKRSRMSTQILNSNIDSGLSEFSSEIEGIVRKKIMEFKQSLLKSIKESTLKEIELKEQAKKRLKKKREINCIEHSVVSCSGCQQYPIKGVRYKCAECSTFDYCESCEKNFGEMHKHPMYILRFPIE